MSNIVLVRDYLAKHKEQIALALPKHVTADRMCRLALTAIGRDKNLALCDARSIFASVVVASQLGLEIGVNGQGFLVPYKGQATFVPGWQGLVDLVSRAGRATVWTGAVFDGDAFDYAIGDSPFVKHRPNGEDDPAKMTHTYAIGRVNGAQWPVVEVWPIARITKHRDKHNKLNDKSKHYSFKHPEMYARKVPLMQVLKYIPKSTELSAAMAVAEASERGERSIIDSSFVVTSTDVDQETGEIKSGLSEKLKAAKEKPQEEAPQQSADFVRGIMAKDVPPKSAAVDEFFKEFDQQGDIPQ